MKRVNTILLFIGLLLIGGLIWGNIAVVSAYNEGKAEITGIYKLYEGRIFFTDQTEYDRFKSELANRTDVSIIKIDELSSENPLIMFRVALDSDAEFPYGTLTEEKVWYAWDLTSLIFGLFLVDLLGGFLIVGYCLFC